MRVALSSAASLDYWSSLWQRAVAQRGSRGARRERSAHGGAAEETSAIPHQPQPEPEHPATTDGLVLPKTEKEGRKEGLAEPCSEERAQRLRSAPPGAKTQVGSKPRPCVFFILGGAGWGGTVRFHPTGIDLESCGRQSTLSAGASSSGAHVDYKLKANKRRPRGRSTRRRTGDSATSAL